MRSDFSTVGQVPATFTERARRAQIIDCAVVTIAELGYARASLAEIGHRAGVSKGVISYHFAGKDELLEQVVADVYTRAGQAIAARTAGATGAEAVLRGYLQANLEFVKAHPADLRAVTEIVFGARGPDGGMRFGPSDGDPVVEHLEGILRAGQDEGTFRAFEPRPVAMVLRAAVDAASGQLLADAEFDVQAYTRELLTLVDLAVVVANP